MTGKICIPAGIGTVAISLNFPNAVVGITYFLDLELTGNNVNIYSDQAIRTRVNVMRVKWEDVGIVEFDDQFWTKEKANVIIQKRSDNNLYRLVEPYSKVFLAIDPTDPDVEACKGFYWEFYLDDDANADKLPSGEQDLGLGMYGYKFYWASSGEPYASYCTFTNEDNVYTIEGVYTNEGEVENTFTLSFTWTEGYPKSE